MNKVLIRFVLVFEAIIGLQLTSCKDEAEPVNADTIIFNFQIAVYTDAITRSVKRGWNPGEQVLIWYDSNTQSDPDLILQYDGSTWDASDVVTAPGSASGTLKALCYADNGTILNSCNLPYTFTDRVLTCRINQWEFMTRMNIVVNGTFANDPASYSLSCSQLSAPGEVSVGTDRFSMTSVQGAPVRGRANDDGLAFVFADCNGFDVESEYLFELITRSGVSDSASVNARFNKTVPDPAMSYCTGIISDGSFSAPVTEGRTWGHDWVQLTADGPKFAKSNLDGYYTLDEAIQACRELGDGWRLMKLSDVNFTSGYTSTRETIGSEYGYKVKGKSTGDSIFFPFHGYYDLKNAFISDRNGYYWISDDVNCEDKYRYYYIAKLYGIPIYTYTFTSKQFRLLARPIYSK